MEQEHGIPWKGPVARVLFVLIFAIATVPASFPGPGFGAAVQDGSKAGENARKEAPDPKIERSGAQGGEKNTEGEKHVDLTPVPGERAAPIETESLDVAGEEIGRAVDLITQKISGALGPWVNVKLWRGITWLKFIVVLSLIALVFITERLFFSWLMGLSRRVPEEGKPVPWKGVLLRTLARPISVFILIYGTYAAISPLFKHFRMPSGRNVVHEVAGNLADIGGAIAIIWLIYRLIWVAGALVQGRLPSPGLFETIVRRCRAPIQFLVMLIVVRSLMPAFGTVPHLFSIMTNILSLVFIGTVGWLATQAVYVASDHLLGTYGSRSRNPLYARKMATQIRFFRRMVITFIILLSAAMGMMVFDKVRQLGTSILASAGIAGIMIGLAAQRTLANLLVGVQIAVTQPIRIGDIVTVENETGTIQDIFSTFAVVQTWDQRSMIVPLTYFTEKQFQNLTLSSSELLGTVPIFVDYVVPIDEIRAELGRILKESPNWDGRTWSLSVANLKENCVELTAVLSATDSASLGNLRSEVREKILAFIQRKFPTGLPRVRAELEVGNLSGGNRRTADRLKDLRHRT